MTRAALGLPVGATNTVPISPMYQRNSKDGVLQVLNFLVGSHYNVNVAGILSTTSVGNIADQSVSTTTGVNGVLNMVCKSNDGTLVQNIATYTSFMYFFPKTAIEGHSQLQHATITVGQTEKLRHIITDLTTGDALIIDWASGVTGTSNATFTVQQIASGVTTTLATLQAANNSVVGIFWEIVYLDNGGTKISYMFPSGTKTLLWQGNLTASLGESKVQLIESVTATSDTTVTSDFFWIFYPAVFCGYDMIDLTQMALGHVKIWDDMNTSLESSWVQVFASDHQYTGQPVVENGLIRLRFQTSTPGIDVYGWSNGVMAYQLVGTLVAEDVNQNPATSIFGIIFTLFGPDHVALTAKWGALDWTVDIRRGNPYARINLNSTYLRFNTSKSRFAISAPSPYTNLDFWNQKGSAGANGGNPLNLASPTNPYTFTNDANVHSGIQNTDDNWVAFYNNTSADDMLGFISTPLLPIAMTLAAVNATTLQYLDMHWSKNSICSVGVLEGVSNALINNIPTPFVVGNVDTYIKWRANEAVYNFDQRIIVRRKK